MGQLAEALRDPQQRRALHQSGGEYDYTDPVEMFGDMTVLKRAFPDTRLLCSDNPLQHIIGYLGYYTLEGQEVVFYFRLPHDAYQDWGFDLRVDEFERRVLAETLRSSAGRRQLIQVVEGLAVLPEPPRPEGTRQSSRSGGARRSAWERLVDDDEPL
jgi:hypothetical protein